MSHPSVECSYILYGGEEGGGGGQFTLMTYTSFVTYRCQLNSELTLRPRNLICPRTVCSSPRIDVPYDFNMNCHNIN